MTKFFQKNKILDIIKMPSLKDLEQRFKNLNLKVGEVRSLKKRFNIKGRWTKEKYTNFF